MTLMIIYKAFAKPHLDYGDIVYGDIVFDEAYNKKYHQKLENI